MHWILGVVVVAWCDGKRLEILRNVTRKRLGCLNGSATSEGASPGAPRGASCGAALGGSPRVALWCEAHRLRLPERFGPAVLCVPQKNGNRDFSLLVHALHYGRLPPSEPAMDDALRRAKLSFSAVGRGDDVYLVARNPYTRLLSLYLDKVLRCFRVGERDPTAGGSYCSHDVMAASGAFRYTPRRQPEDAPSFPDFVRMVAALAGERDICEIDHHLCTQASGCALAAARSVTVLKLEDEAAWFPCLARALGLEDALLRGDMWTQWKPHACFYAPTGSCDEAADAGRTTGVVHATGADARVDQYYDAATAAAVRRLYADDFALLGYADAPPDATRPRHKVGIWY